MLLALETVVELEVPLAAAAAVEFELSVVFDDEVSAESVAVSLVVLDEESVASSVAFEVESVVFS